MDLKDQLKKLFPDHEVPEDPAEAPGPEIWVQDEPILCKYEKRRGKPHTILEGYNGAEADFQALARELKSTLGTGGSTKNNYIIIQGDFRDRIMEILQQKGFKTKRVGG
jgi:translation initiation factor 1